MAQPQPADRRVLDRLRPEILPRNRWAGELGPVGSLDEEEDVRFVLIHHTASRNDYGRNDTPEEIRSFYPRFGRPRHRGYSRPLAALGALLALRRRRSGTGQ